MSITRHARVVRDLENQGFKQLIQTPLPDPKVLRKIQANPKLIDHHKKNDELYACLRNLEAQSPKYFRKNLSDLIVAIEKIHKLINSNDTSKLIPVSQSTEIGIVNRMSQRLFLKNNELYWVRHNDLLKAEENILNAEKNHESFEMTLTPQRATTFRGTFAILLSRDNSGYSLEHRINRSVGEIAGHPSLVHGQNQSVIIIGEEFLNDGKHKLSSNKTGGFHQLVKEHDLTLDDQRAIMNFCLHGLGNVFYGVQLAKGWVDEVAYKKARDAAGVNEESTPLTKFNLVAEKQSKMMSQLSAPPMHSAPVQKKP